MFNKLIPLIVFGAFCSHAKVRTISPSETDINRVYLKLGRSTVLRFSDTPVRAVIGNQNYFNLEFIKGSNDLTIQPLAKNTTNLFVYTESKTYAFYLEFHPKKYDDLVNVKNSQDKSLKLKEVPLELPEKKSCFKKIRGSSFSGSLKEVIYIPKLKSYIFDGVFFSKKNISTKLMKFKVTRNNKPLRVEKVGFSRKSIDVKGTRFRVLMKLKEVRGVTVHFKFKKVVKFIVPKRCL